MFVTIAIEGWLFRRIVGNNYREVSWTHRPNLESDQLELGVFVGRTWNGLPIGDVKVATWNYEGQSEHLYTSMREHTHKDVESSLFGREG